MTQYGFFTKQLAHWLHSADWHFTTLLASVIESVRPVPNNADILVNDILLTFPKPPTWQCLYRFLLDYPTVKSWYVAGEQKARIRQINLQVYQPNELLYASLPEFNNTDELAYWLAISPKQLHNLADLWHRQSHSCDAFCHYHYHFLHKRNSSLRLIESPKSRLKAVQRQINWAILRHIPVHNAAHGFRYGRNCRTHAELHMERSRLFKFDLANCFHSITWRLVYRVFRGLGYSLEISKYLTGLCTHQTRTNSDLPAQLDVAQQRRVRQRHLPQGAPTSPALSNIVLCHLDKRLSGLANSLGMTYSRYADDLAFSSDTQRDWRFLEPLVGAICLEQGFELNYHKTQIRQSHQRQLLTGVVVNQKLNVDRRYYDRLKAILTNCVRYGLQSQNRDQHTDFRAHLLGCIAHVNALNEVKGNKLKILYEQII